MHLYNNFHRYALIALVVLSFTLVSCTDASLEKIEKLIPDERFPTETGKDITFIYSDSARVRARLETPLMHKYIEEETTIEMPEGLEVTFYSRLKEPNSYLSADYGIQYVEKRIIEVKKNVVVVNLKGDTLTTEHLIWEEKKDKVYSDQFVRVKTVDEIIFAEGFESNTTFSYYEFKNIKGTIQLKTDDEEEE